MNENKKRNPAKLFWVVILLIILYAVLDVIAQSLPPHYSPISQAESDLAVGRFGFIMTLNFLNRGVLSYIYLCSSQNFRSNWGCQIPFSNGHLFAWRVGSWSDTPCNIPDRRTCHTCFVARGDSYRCCTDRLHRRCIRSICHFMETGQKSRV